MGLIPILINAPVNTGVGQADKVVQGVLSKFYVPKNLPATASFVIEEVLPDGETHPLYTFSTVTSPYAYSLQRQSAKEDGTDSGTYVVETVGGRLQIRANGLDAGTIKLWLLVVE